MLGRSKEYVNCSEVALSLLAGTGNLREEFNGLCHLGDAYAGANMRKEAVAAFERQVEVATLMKSGNGVCHGREHLAGLHLAWDNPDAAIAQMNAGVEFCRTTENRHDLPESTFLLALVMARAGRVDEAIDIALDARELFDDIGDGSCAYRVDLQIEEWE